MPDREAHAMTTDEDGSWPWHHYSIRGYDVRVRRTRDGDGTNFEVQRRGHPISHGSCPSRNHRAVAKAVVDMLAPRRPRR